jgi:hypothetical protein
MTPDGAQYADYCSTLVREAKCVTYKPKSWKYDFRFHAFSCILMKNKVKNFESHFLITIKTIKCTKKMGGTKTV